ncbi:protein of unknown function [Candidatus Hydrogenisulfobacillus filiaventi]|uniref:Uncharacterized protein n=1 Tax=Candidatus Hydrogenisulfobacillus filiaventi TaxID=2707344 RepID=A0A6F8ZFC7_9FIRM|nr:hypothetical protein [Bacillota bacterium]CAB1128404.1 protein of unknown function [Candidatus Hydrogenisulfobacillus filiaventi]
MSFGDTHRHIVVAARVQSIRGAYQAPSAAAHSPADVDLYHWLQAFV